MSFDDGDWGWDAEQNPLRDPLIARWKVWFAWRPVLVWRYDERGFRDATCEWQWLRNVARRRNNTGLRIDVPGHWEYAPAHKAVTQ